MLKLIFLFATLILLIATSNGCIKEGLLDGRSSGSIWKRDTIGISEGANLDPAIKKLEKETFNLCEENGEPGLTWDEVEQCEERYAGLIRKDFAMPSKEDFFYFDENADGVLFYEEWLDVLNIE